MVDTRAPECCGGPMHRDGLYWTCDACGVTANFGPADYPRPNNPGETVTDTTDTTDTPEDAAFVESEPTSAPESRRELDELAEQVQAHHAAVDTVVYDYETYALKSTPSELGRLLLVIPSKMLDDSVKLPFSNDLLIRESAIEWTEDVATEVIASVLHYVQELGSDHEDVQRKLNARLRENETPWKVRVRPRKTDD